MKFGAHMSTSGGFHRAIQRGRQVGCEAVQIFVKSNMRWSGPPPQQFDVKQFMDELARQDPGIVFGHTGYLINIAAQDGPTRESSIKSLIQEIEYADTLGLPFMVLHPGAHVGAGETAGLRMAARALDEVFSATGRCKVRIALENTAGQGSCIGNKLEHIAEIYQTVANPKRLGVCIDTAHLFAAGFDIRTAKGWDNVTQEIDRLVGLGQILAFHLNDSKTGLGSRVDRHEHIGKGQIGAEGFRAIAGDGRFLDHPGCLETPKSEDLHEDLANLAMLRKLAGASGVTRKPQAPKVSNTKPRRRVSGKK